MQGHIYIGKSLRGSIFTDSLILTITETFQRRSKFCYGILKFIFVENAKTNFMRAPLIPCRHI